MKGWNGLSLAAQRVFGAILFMTDKWPCSLEDKEISILLAVDVADVDKCVREIREASLLRVKRLSTTKKAYALPKQTKTNNKLKKEFTPKAPPSTRRRKGKKNKSAKVGTQSAKKNNNNINTLNESERIEVVSSPLERGGSKGGKTFGSQSGPRQTYKRKEGPAPIPPHEAYPLMERCFRIIAAKPQAPGSVMGKRVLKTMYARLREGATKEDLVIACEQAAILQKTNKRFVKLWNLIYVWSTEFSSLLGMAENPNGGSPVLRMRTRGEDVDYEQLAAQDADADLDQFLEENSN